MDSNTHFRNLKRRVIFQSAQGSFFVKKADGKKVYNPKARFHVANASANLVKVHSGHSIPMKIRPARMAKAHTGSTARHTGGRKIRRNKGVARGPREGYLQRKMNAESKRRAMPKKKKIPLRIFKRSNPFAALQKLTR